MALDVGAVAHGLEDEASWTGRIAHGAYAVFDAAATACRHLDATVGNLYVSQVGGTAAGASAMLPCTASSSTRPATTRTG